MQKTRETVPFKFTNNKTKGLLIIKEKTTNYFIKVGFQSKRVGQPQKHEMAIVHQHEDGFFMINTNMFERCRCQG